MLHPPRQHFLTIVLLQLYLSSLIRISSISHCQEEKKKREGARYAFIHDCLAILVGSMRNIPLTVSLSLELWDLNWRHIREEIQEEYLISGVTTPRKRLRGDSDQLNEETAS